MIVANVGILTYYFGFLMKFLYIFRQLVLLFLAETCLWYPIILSIYLTKH